MTNGSLCRLELCFALEGSSLSNYYAISGAPCAGLLTTNTRTQQIVSIPQAIAFSGLLLELTHAPNIKESSANVDRVIVPH